MPLSPEDFLTLSPCRFTAEDQDAVDQEISFESLARSWLSAAASSSCNRVGCFLDVGSKINALHALYSLQKVAHLVQSYERSAHIEYTHVVAARPDTSFLSPLPLSEVALPRMRGVRIPNTHQWAGINDRFAWGEARAMLDVYMRQYAQISSRGWRNATSTEHFLCLHLAEAHVPLGVTRVCVVRTRAGGQLKLDDQAPKWVGAPYPNYRSCLRTAIDEPKITDYILDRPGDSTPPCATNPVTTSSSECLGGDCSTRDKARQRRSTARVIDIFSYGGAHYDRTLELRHIKPVEAARSRHGCPEAARRPADLHYPLSMPVTSGALLRPLSPRLTSSESRPRSWRPNLSWAGTTSSMMWSTSLWCSRWAARSRTISSTSASTVHGCILIPVSSTDASKTRHCM